MRFSKHLLVASLVTLLVACAGNDEETDLEDRGERYIYNIIQKQLNNDSYIQAVENLQLLESRYPFGEYAEQAQLELIYAYYKSFDFEASAAAAERFIRLHPRHPDTDYAYYMKGLAKYSESQGLFDRFLPTDSTQRDLGSARQSFNDFAELLARYPDSEYAADAKARMIHMRNQLARYEIHVANYYFKRKAYLAAANRGRYVVENFQQTPAVADGLAVMVQAYQLLNLNELADTALQTLVENYPEHPSLDDRGQFISHYKIEQQQTWLGRLSFGVLDRSRPPAFDNRPK
jgi:outer membrane protein assembly factor BamD